MKKFFLLATFILPFGVFAQTNNINPQVQMQNANYYNQIDDSNNSLGNASNEINKDANPIQTNLGNFKQTNPPAQVQQQQSSESVFGLNEKDNNHEKVYCKDCEAVKKALAAAHASSGASHRGKAFSMNQWSKKISGSMYMKMRKTFAHHKKVKTSYEICFNWI